jgi:ribosomal protein S18 acetylase RimI-like enzyme
MASLQGGQIRADFMVGHQTEQVLARLRHEPRHNLLLMDLVASTEEDPGVGIRGCQVVVASRGAEIVGVASLRPSLILEDGLESETLAAVLPFLSRLEAGLIKSQAHAVGPGWECLRSVGRNPLLDRYEECHVLDTKGLREGPRVLPAGASLRRGEPSDLDALVFAARSSLREEDRPDPSYGDPQGFRRWVRGRIGRARLLEVAGQPVFVGYADVCRPEGWLIQGVYTWPDQRRRGYARAGMLGMVDEAVQAGAEHVQLAVVEGNRPALGLYGSLGFRALSRLRTILFN